MHLFPHKDRHSLLSSAVCVKIRWVEVGDGEEYEIFLKQENPFGIVSWAAAETMQLVAKRLDDVVVSVCQFGDKTNTLAVGSF